VSALKEFWNDDTYERFPNEECRGADQIAAYFESVFAAMPDFHIEVVNIAEQNDDVYVQWHMTGHHTGPAWSGVEPTGKRIEMDGIDHFVLRDGNVVSNFVVFDQMQFARAVGMLPPDGSGADKAMKAAFNARTKLMARLRR
jgi:predicted ester cyclase